MPKNLLSGRKEREVQRFCLETGEGTTFDQSIHRKEDGASGGEKKHPCCGGKKILLLCHKLRGGSVRIGDPSSLKSKRGPSSVTPQLRAKNKKVGEKGEESTLRCGVGAPGTGLLKEGESGKQESLAGIPKSRRGTMIDLLRRRRP